MGAAKDHPPKKVIAAQKAAELTKTKKRRTEGPRKLELNGGSCETQG
jgi:hypothetical protein